MKSVQEIETLSFFEDDNNEQPPADIIAYNELRSCADLFRMHQQGILEIQPEFQRDVVWTSAAQTRFIDSLIKQLPIPSMCFSFDYKIQKWLVIDGLQRLSTIIEFLKGTQWQLSRLDDITPEIAGKTAAELKDIKSPLHHYFTRVENLTIPITVLRCDYKKKDHMEYLFTIFHRLNSGGMKINNQEIRNCIYGGDLNNLLKDLDKTPSWRRINRMKKDENYRLTKQELILRFFAFSERHKKYAGGLSKFLNSYMQDYRNPGQDFLNDRSCLFIRVANLIDEKIFDKKQPAKISITVLEALFVAIGKNIDELETQSAKDIKSKYHALTSHANFSDALILEGLSKRARVIDRLDTAINIFS